MCLYEHIHQTHGVMVEKVSETFLLSQTSCSCVYTASRRNVFLRTRGVWCDVSLSVSFQSVSLGLTERSHSVSDKTFSLIIQYSTESPWKQYLPDKVSVMSSH